MPNQDSKMKTKKKIKKNESATIYIRGIVANSDAFYTVSAKQFFVGLTQLGRPLNIDLRLKDSHKLDTYHVNQSDLDNFRLYGIHTTLVGYIYKSTYRIHYSLYHTIQNILHMVDKYNLDIIKANLRIKELVPVEVKRVC